MGLCLARGSRERLYQRFGSQTQSCSAPSPCCREAGLRLGGPEAIWGLLPSPTPPSSLNPIALVPLVIQEPHVSPHAEHPPLKALPMDPFSRIKISPTPILGTVPASVVHRPALWRGLSCPYTTVPR